MKKMFLFATAATVAAFAFGENVSGYDESDPKTYVVTVPAGETNALGAADVAVLTGNAATNFAKRGLGTLEVANDLSAYVGNVTVEEGVYLSRPQTRSNATLGAATGGAITVRNGATLALLAKVEHTTLGRPVYFEGEGFGGQGALVNCAGSAGQMSTPFGKGLHMTGDAKVASYAGQWFFLVSNWSVFDFGGHALTLHGEHYPIMFENSGKHVGQENASILAAGKGIDLSGDIGYNYFYTPIVVAENAWCVFNGIGGYYQNPLTLKAGAEIRLYSNNNGNVFRGTLALEDPIRNRFDLHGYGMQVDHPVSGGGIYATGGGGLGLSNTGNSFTNGVVLAGGVSLRLGGYSALPDRGPLVMTNSSVIAVGSHATGATWTLPSLHVHGTGLVSQATGTWRDSVTKTGEGELVYDSWIGSNELKLEGGSFRFPTKTYAGSGNGAVNGLPYFRTITARSGTAIDFSGFSYNNYYLNGFMAISNCPSYAVSVQWKFSAADAVAGGCVRSDGKIVLGGAVPLAWDAAGARARGHRTYEVMRAEGGIAIPNGFNDGEVKAGDFDDSWRLRLSADGKSLLLDHIPAGLTLIVR